MILTPAAEGMPGAMRKADELVAQNKNYFMPQQFKNPANPEIHRKTTAEEIWRDTDGAGRHFRHRRRHRRHDHRRGRSAQDRASRACKIVAVEPTNSPVITQRRAGQPLKPGRHTIQGIGAGFIPDVLNVDIIDDVVLVQDEDAMETAPQYGQARRADVRHQLRRRRLGRDRSGQAARERRQADRRHPARPGRAVPVDEAVSGMKRSDGRVRSRSTDRAVAPAATAAGWLGSFQMY